jgi:UDP-2,4-diacetamido-2,4,6-trideoxy-beta-L-altropyranose hydrolase
MRCLTLAQELRKAKQEVAFICRELPGDMTKFIEQSGFMVYRLSPLITAKQTETMDSLLAFIRVSDAGDTGKIISKIGHLDWIVVDHYGIDHIWERQIRSFAKNIMVIDDLADRIHDCDLLLDQNLYEDLDLRYSKLVPAGCRILLGPRFALLRDEFYKARQQAKVRNGTVNNLFVFFGGADLTNETAKTLRALKNLRQLEIEIDVVIGAMNPHRSEVEALVNSMSNVKYYCQVSNMAEMMLKADLAIGAGGSTTWERCCVGLPAHVITVAQNQVELVQTAHSIGAVKYLGHYDAVSEDTIVRALSEAINRPADISKMSSIAMQMTGSLSGPQQVVNVILEEANGK